MKENQSRNTNLIIYLTLPINGNSSDEVEILSKEVKIQIRNPNNSVRHIINAIIHAFDLPKTDESGGCLLYFLALVVEDPAAIKILASEDKYGKEISLTEHNIKAEDHLLLFSIPSIPHSSPIPDNENKDSLFVTLSIEGSQLGEVEVEITDPMRTISEQIKRIVETFELQKMDSRGNPITYLLGKIEDSDSITFEFQDEQGHEQTLLDYNVKFGDKLFLITQSCAYGGPIPDDFQQKTKIVTPSQRIKRFFSRLLHKIK